MHGVQYVAGRPRLPVFGIATPHVLQRPGRLDPTITAGAPSAWQARRSRIVWSVSTLMHRGHSSGGGGGFAIPGQGTVAAHRRR